MTIKLIAVDMDGTFLSDEKTYDRARFQRQYEQLKRLGIHFVVASGNQLQRLHAYFDDYDYNFSYVAENGAYVTHGDQPLKVTHLSRENGRRVLRFLDDHAALRPIICAREGAYILDTVFEQEQEQALKYYRRLKVISSYDQIDDDILKIALYMGDDNLAGFNEILASDLPDLLVSVTSGHQFVDLIIPGIHKAFGLKTLQTHLGIADHEVVVFGDNSNDIEMLGQAGFGFAMSNAVESAKSAARFTAGHNNESGVLDILELIIEGSRKGENFEQLFSYFKHG